MKQVDIEQFRKRIALNQRGRPKTALPEVRVQGYKDADGKDVLSEGLKPWHERVVDHMILNPHAKIVDLAEFFRVTPQWMGRLLKTDAFVDYYQKRMETHQGVLHTQIIHKMQGVAIKALDQMATKITASDAPFAHAKDAADLTLKGLGYTQSNGNNVHLNVNNKDGVIAVQVGADAVAQAKKRIQERMQNGPKNIEQDHDKDNYSYVTAALELKTEAVDIDKARDVTPDDESE